MTGLERQVDELSRVETWTYRASRCSAAEPAAWTAVALARYGHPAAARPAQWLAALQQPDGSIGVSAAEKEPRWPTSLAILAWCAANHAAGDNRFASQIEAAVAWSLEHHGKPGRRSPQIGHDPTITGWSWAANTHSWLEPTCFFALGLRAAGLGDHARVHQAVALIVDRLLPSGGANYGNTFVLGQQLLAHLQPTGLAMLALGGLPVSDARIGRSLDYLNQSVTAQTAPASMAFGCLGLAAHRRWPMGANGWIEAAFSHPPRGPLAAYEQALLLLAAQGKQSLIPLLN